MWARRLQRVASTMIETNIGEPLLSTTLRQSDRVPAIDLPALACR
jgi:hypothetical protein